MESGYSRWCIAILSGLLVFGLAGWAPSVRDDSGGTTLTSTQASALPLASVPSTVAPVIELTDDSTGRVLYSREATKRHQIASITKLMTALISVSRLKLDKVVTISARAAGTQGSSMYLAAGDEVPVRSLLYGMLVQSGDDAAEALAESMAGDDTRFASLMNRRAAKYGLTCSRFATPNGLPAPNQYSCASDVAKLSHLALANPLIRSIVNTRTITVPSATAGLNYNLFTTNLLLGNYPGAIGVKTGTTPAAGACLAGAAVRDGHTLIAVILGSTESSRFSDDENVLNFGFSNFIWPQAVDTMWSTESLQTHRTPRLGPVAKWREGWVRVNSAGSISAP